jgi:hypothetical protein
MPVVFLSSWRVLRMNKKQCPAHGEGEDPVEAEQKAMLLPLPRSTNVVHGGRLQLRGKHIDDAGFAALRHALCARGKKIAPAKMLVRSGHTLII